MYSESRLGQVWQILTPLLNAAVYFLIFGVILDTKRGVPNFIPFLVTGIFVFTFTQRSFIIASRVISDSLPLIRALHFPRACLPLGYILIELQQMLLSMAVLVVIVLGFGEPLTWYWLLAMPVLVTADSLQRRRGAVPRAHGRGRGRCQPADPVHRAHLDVRLRGHVLHPRAEDPLPAREADLPAPDQPRRGLHRAGQELAAGLTEGHVQRHQPYNRTRCEAQLAYLAKHPSDNPALIDHCHLVVGGPSLWLYARRLGGARDRDRVLRLLAGGGDLRPWLNRWSSLTICTSSTA